MPTESHIYYIDPLEPLKKRRLIHFKSIILKAASATIEKKFTKYSTLEVDFFANFHPTHVFFGGGFLNALKIGKRKSKETNIN